MNVSNRMNQFREGVFTELLHMKRQKEGEGESVVDLSVGTPNIPPAPHIKEAITKACEIDTNYAYALDDTPPLKEAVSQWYHDRYHVILNPETEICSLLGSQEGLAHIAMVLTDPGDIVLVPDPAYPIFGDGPRLAGCQIYPVPLEPTMDYAMNLEAIDAEIARKAKLIIVSYPNNPTAVLAPEGFYDKLIAFAKANDIWVLHDNAYSELVFDGGYGGSFLEYEGAKEVGVEFNSLSKTYGIAGARCGFCLGNETVIKGLKALKSNIDYGMFLPIQEGAIAAIRGNQQCVGDTRSIYERRRDILCQGFTRVGWPITPSMGTMFVWAKIPDTFGSSKEFCTLLLHKAGILVTPGDAFGKQGEGYVRMALVQDESVLEEAVKRLESSGLF